MPTIITSMWSPSIRGKLIKRILQHVLAILMTDSGGSRPGAKVSGTQPKFPNLIENGQKSHFFLRGFSDSEPSQHFV